MSDSQNRSSQPEPAPKANMIAIEQAAITIADLKRKNENLVAALELMNDVVRENLATEAAE